MSSKQQAMEEGRLLSLYEASEKADEGMGEEGFDNLWQSLYDIYKLSVYGILEEVSEEEMDALGEWLCKYQELTEAYQEVGLPF